MYMYLTTHTCTTCVARVMCKVMNSVAPPTLGTTNPLPVTDMASCDCVALVVGTCTCMLISSPQEEGTYGCGLLNDLRGV